MFGFQLKSFFLSGVVVVAYSGLLSLAQAPNNATPADIVNPNIGVLGTGDGSVVIGPTLPHGSIHPSPDTAAGGQAGYRSDKPIRGFSQLHASGTGWGEYGNLLLSPQIGLEVAPDGHDSPKAEEKAESYAYRVRLSRYEIVTELSPTQHAAIYRFTFPASDQAHLMLDLGQQIPGQLGTKPGDGKVVDSEIHLDPKHHSFSGSSRYSGGFGGGEYVVYFYGQMNQRPGWIWDMEECDHPTRFDLRALDEGEGSGRLMVAILYEGQRTSTPKDRGLSAQHRACSRLCGRGDSRLGLRKGSWHLPGKRGMTR